MCEVPLSPSLTQMPNAIALRHLRYFVAATEEGSFRKAALSLSVQESSVSRRIRNLEDQIGASLFHRHSSGVALTVAGERFLPAARKAPRTLTEGTRDIQVIARGRQGDLLNGSSHRDLLCDGRPGASLSTSNPSRSESPPSYSWRAAPRCGNADKEKRRAGDTDSRIPDFTEVRPPDRAASSLCPPYRGGHPDAACRVRRR